jgi:hypothetical protein
MSSDSLSSYETLSSSLQTDLVRWRDESASDVASCCKDVDELDSKLRDAIKEARMRESKYFEHDLRKDRPTGETPGRILRSYPRNLVEGTPDDVRVKMYRQKHDLGAAMKLNIEDDGDDLEESKDSVFSGSTNVTNDTDDHHQQIDSRTLSRQSSRDMISDTDTTSEYTSDRVSSRVDLEIPFAAQDSLIGITTTQFGLAL